jgi:hypothetical protein
VDHDKNLTLIHPQGHPVASKINDRMVISLTQEDAGRLADEITWLIESALGRGDTELDTVRQVRALKDTIDTVRYTTPAPGDRRRKRA